MSLPSHVDVAIIGAGAAGIGAARALDGKGLTLLMLEARDRLGGRAFTKQLPNNLIFDVGCHWLHSADRNKFVPIAEKLGFEIDRGRPHWSQQTFNIGFPLEERRAYMQEMEAFYDRAEKAVADRGPDRPASELLKPGNRWNAMLNCVSTYINGVELDRMSIYDMDAYEDTEFNWRSKRGLGALVAAYGAPCPVSFNTQVTLIDHSGPRIRIETSRGTLTADRVVVTVPTNLIANETLRFHPPLPDKVNAARGLPLGLADKVMLALDDDGEALPKDGHLRGSTTRVGAGSYHLRPQGAPGIEGFFGGQYARDLEKAGEAAFAEAAIDEVVNLLGSDYRKKLRLASLSRWEMDEYATGSYSHALPGHAGDRAKLATPFEGRIFFAGEATHPHFFSTCHGALESGMRAAKEAVKAATASLRRTPRVLGAVLTGFLATCLLLQFIDPASAQTGSATTINLEWTEIVDRVSPNPRAGILTRKNMTVTLRGGNEISQAYESRSGKFSSGSVRDSRLGAAWRVVSGNVLTRADNYPNHLRVLTVRVDGPGSCNLSVTHELEAGQTTYLYPMISRPGQTGRYSRIATQSASCTIR